MKDLESKITELIISKIDVAAAAELAKETILESKEFGDKFETAMLGYSYQHDSLIHRVYGACVEKLAERYIAKHGAKILEQIDPSAIANGIMFQAINKTQDKMAAR